MRKEDDGKKGGGEKKIITDIVATDFITSRLAERRQTATPTARPNHIRIIISEEGILTEDLLAS